MGMSEKELQEIENINWFNDILCDFIYDRYENKYKSFILILKNWSKLNLDNIFEIGGHVYDYRERLKLLAKELLKVQKIKRNMNNF
jgi:hypothetical protein